MQQHELVQIVALTLQISIMVQVFAIGLGTNWRDATYLFRQPKLLLNSILARNVAVPIVAILLIKIFSIHSAVAIAIAVLAVTPVPPLLPKSQLKAGCRSEYALGLLVSQAVLAIVIVPLTVEAMSWVLGGQAQFSAAEVAKLMIRSVLIPLGAGMLTARVAPRLQSLAPNLMKAGTVLLVIGALPLLAVAWKALGELAGDGTLLALALLVILSTAIGHFFGGPSAEDRTTLATATSARHPALALAIAKANFPEQITLVAGAVVIYLVLRMLLSFPYMTRHRPAHA